MVGLHIYRLVDDALILESSNAAADAILGVQCCGLQGRRLEDLFPAFCAADLVRGRQVAAKGGEFGVSNVSYGSVDAPAILNFSIFSIAQNRVAIAFHDVAAHRQADAEREHLLAQLIQAQKLESMGRLASGVVHDFNNLLHGIMGQMEFCRDELGTGHPVHAHLTEIAEEAQRSARLLKQLLSFVSRQAISPQNFDVNEAVTSMLKLLQRLLGDEIELVWRPDASAGAVRMDPSQFDQILTNLVVNARDAIQGAGRLTIETRHVALDNLYEAAHPGFVPGEYVQLTLRDTGCGMDAETSARMFDLFFTTKPSGHGSGLGLATVQRIIQENDGFIKVQSACGKGSVFNIYLPRQESDTTNNVCYSEGPPVGGAETILLVEDEKIIRLTTCRMLQKLGYTVLMAESPEEALRLVAKQTTPIHLLLTDMVLPGGSGRELAAKLAKEFPAMKCLLMSGHATDMVANREQQAGAPHFIAKPFSFDNFARKIREVIEDKVVT